MLEMKMGSTVIPDPVFSWFVIILENLAFSAEMQDDSINFHRGFIISVEDMTTNLLRSPIS